MKPWKTTQRALYLRAKSSTWRMSFSLTLVTPLSALANVYTRQFNSFAFENFLIAEMAAAYAPFPRIASFVSSEPSMLTEIFTSFLTMFSKIFWSSSLPSVIMLAFKPSVLACSITSKRSFLRNGCPPVIPKKLAPNSLACSTIFLASSVLTSSGAAGFPAEVQCTQLLSQAKVHRHGMMKSGPLFFTVVSPFC